MTRADDLLAQIRYAIENAHRAIAAGLFQDLDDLLTTGAPFPAEWGPSVLPTVTLAAEDGRYYVSTVPDAGAPLPRLGAAPRSSVPYGPVTAAQLHSASLAAQGAVCSHGADCELHPHVGKLHNFAGEPAMPGADAAARILPGDAGDWMEVIAPDAAVAVPDELPLTTESGKRIGTAKVTRTPEGFIAEYTVPAGYEGRIRLGWPAADYRPAHSFQFTFEPDIIPAMTSCPSCGGPLDHTAAAASRGLVLCERQPGPHAPVGPVLPGE